MNKPTNYTPMEASMPNPLGGVNPQKVSADEAYLRGQYRKQDIEKDREDPQVGPLENRSRTADRKTRA